MANLVHLEVEGLRGVCRCTIQSRTSGGSDEDCGMGSGTVQQLSCQVNIAMPIYAISMPREYMNPIDASYLASLRNHELFNPFNLWRRRWQKYEVGSGSSCSLLYTKECAKPVRLMFRLARHALTVQIFLKPIKCQMYTNATVSIQLVLPIFTILFHVNFGRCAMS